MSEILTLSVIGLTLTGLVVGAILLIKWKSGYRREVNYRALYIIGITFLPAAAYLAIALANRDKWKK